MANLGEPKRYKMTDHHYDTLMNVFNEVKRDINNNYGWNRPVEQLDGCMMSNLGQNTIKLSHAKYVVSSRYALEKRDKSGAKEFLDNVAKQMAKRYQEVAGTSVNFSLVEERQDVEAVSKYTPDQSWALGSVQGVMVGKYNITTSRIYKVTNKNLRVDHDE